jgi:hypothetical protein
MPDRDTGPLFRYLYGAQLPRGGVSKTCFVQVGHIRCFRLTFKGDVDVNVDVDVDGSAEVMNMKF